MYKIGFVCDTEEQATRLRNHVKKFFELEELKKDVREFKSITPQETPHQ